MCLGRKSIGIHPHDARASAFVFCTRTGWPDDLADEAECVTR